MIKQGNEIIITEDESKICLLDGKKFESSKKMIWYVRKTYHLNFEEYIIKSFYNRNRPVCLKTGNKLAFKGNKLGPWFKNYSKNCFPRKSHTNETKKKIKEGCEKVSMEKFGVKNVFSTDWCKEKLKKTMLEKYGVENIMKTESMKDLFSTFTKTKESIEKQKNTCIRKYGAKTYNSSESGKSFLRIKIFKRYYKDWEDYESKLRNNHILCINGSFKCIENNEPLIFKCEICNKIWKDQTYLMVFCQSCIDNFKNTRSELETSLFYWLKNNINIPFICNTRPIIDGIRFEADIKFENPKLVIELNGLRFHSEFYGNKDRHYHLKKTEFFNSIGYRTIHIFEDEWKFKSDIIKTKLLHILHQRNSIEKIYARKCYIKEITNKECVEFLNKTHLQGGINSKYCYGAYYKDKLIAVMTFSHMRKSLGNKNVSNTEFELIRFSTSNEFIVVGIASKLFSHFIKNYNPSKIISYVDRRWSEKESNLYKSMNMNMIFVTKPNYWYIKGYKRKHRFNFTKQKLIKMGYDPLKSELEIMREIGYDRIWDCGNLKYEWINKNEN